MTPLPCNRCDRIVEDDWADKGWLCCKQCRRDLDGQLSVGVFRIEIDSTGKKTRTPARTEA